MFIVIFFFFKQKTAYEMRISDWSSDVCSSDLDAREWLDAGFRELMTETAIVLIEWPEKAGDVLSPPDMDIFLEYADTSRNACLSAQSDKGRLWLTQLITPRL